MSISGNKYCAGSGLSDKCKTCQNQRNWIALDDMPREWRKKAQKSMTTVNVYDCTPWGHIQYTPAEEKGK